MLLLLTSLTIIWSWNVLVSETMNILTPTPPEKTNPESKGTLDNIVNASRRILFGSPVHEDRQYMVFLRLPPSSSRYQNYRSWFCGGVIVHEEYILTSAACIEDVRHFYVISGTYSHNIEDDIYTNTCFKNGARKAVWKCIPRNYVFDGHENDNLRWMNNDIAVVKVDEEFDFHRRIRGCDFIPKPIRYNNESVVFEKPGTASSIAGWGSLDRYSDWVNRRQAKFPVTLMETHVEIISKKMCKRLWGARYHNIIDNYMICTKDNVLDLSEVCREKYAECTDIMYSDENRRRVLNPEKMMLHSANHHEVRRYRTPTSGGFCENDHGGPLVHGSGYDSIVTGIISACLVRQQTNKCYGPFLYTSVYKNRKLINCAIFKNVGSDCSRVFRSGDSFIEEDLVWTDHPDGPAKNEVKTFANGTVNSYQTTAERTRAPSTPNPNVTVGI